MRSWEIQRNWYGKRSLSIHGFSVVAQIGDQKRRTEIFDLWSEDTKQDSWFGQSTMDVAFRWLENEIPGFHVWEVLVYHGQPILIVFVSWFSVALCSNFIFCLFTHLWHSPNWNKIWANSTITKDSTLSPRI